MKLRNDLTGRKFGRLKVIEFSHSKNRRSYWLCLCSCGNKKAIRSDQLTGGRTKSCGCLNIDKLKLGRNHSHGYSKTKLYAVYYAMRARCYSKTNKDFNRYGGRGIKICEEWLGKEGFLTFRSWALQNGYKEGLSIDRIDVDGDYEPNNCRWVDFKTQSRNKSNNRKIKINGIEKCLIEWCESFGISRSTVKDRMRNGWTELDAITTPVDERKSPCKVN